MCLAVYGPDISASPSSFRDAPLGAGPESITTIVRMDSGLALRAPRNDECEKSEHHALMLEQPALALQTAAIFDPRAVGADQAMAGHHDADRVAAVGVADRAHGPGDIQFRGQRAVAHGGAGWNLWQRGPDLVLERRAGHAPLDRLEAIEIALEISCQRRFEIPRRRRVLQHHCAILQPQQVSHAWLVFLPIQRAKHAI